MSTSRYACMAWLCATVTAAAAATAAGTSADTAAIEKQIAQLEREVNDAYAGNDLPKYFGYYADDMSAIFSNTRTTLADYRSSWTKSVQGGEPIEAVKIADMQIRVSPAGDTAVASYQIDVRTKHKDAKSTNEHAIETDVWTRRAGAWKITHVHYCPNPPT